MRYLFVTKLYLWPR